MIARVRRDPPWWLVPYVVGGLGWMAVLLAGGVGLGESLRYVAYEVAFVLAPGCAMVAVLLPKLRLGVLLVTLGAGVGLALELTAFIVTAWLGMRPLFDLWPVLAIGGAIVVFARRRRDARSGVDESPGAEHRKPATPMIRWHTAAVVIACLAVGYLALGLFPQTPAVTSSSSPSYYPDLTFNLALIVELGHRMPPSEPQVAGLPLIYHWFSDAHMAAIAQVSGIEPWTLLTRLVPTFWLAVIVVQLAAVGTAISGRRWVGPLAALFVFGLGELDLSLTQAVPFLGTFRSNLWQSPSFLFGLTVFLPSLLVLAPGTPGPIRAARSANRWILALALTAACVGMKATVLPVLLGGAVFAAAIGTLRRRAVDRPAFGTVILAGAAIFIGSRTMYRGVETGLLIEPLASVGRAPAWLLLSESSVVRALGLVGDVVLGAAILAALLAPVAGVVLLDRRRMLAGMRPWLAGVGLAGLGAFLIFNHPGLSQLYFLHYAIVAGAMLGAWTLVDVLRHGVLRTPLWRRHLGLAVGASVLVAGTALVAARLAKPPIVVFALPYVSLVAAALVVAALSALVAREGRRLISALVVVSTVLMAASLDAPLDLAPAVDRLLSGRAVVAQDGPAIRGLTTELLDGLRWIRDHTSPDAIVAVNDPFLKPRADPRSFLVSGFGERRVYLEGWAYSAENQIVMQRRLEGLPAGEPFADRRSANSAVFERADPNAAAILRSAGVTYLFVDTRAGASRLDGIAALVFENSEVRIYRLP